MPTPREVSGTDQSLSEVIAAGGIVAPELMGFNDWQTWRRTTRTRPTKPKGDPVGWTQKEEVELWKSTMDMLFGSDWADQLAAREAAEADEESDEESRLVLAVAGAAGGGAPAASEADTAAESRLWDQLDEEYDPTKMSKERWQAALAEIAGQLIARGYVLNDDDLKTISYRTTYSEMMQGLTLAQQAALLKSEFGKVLLDEESYSPVEWNSRLQVLVAMLRRRGHEISQSASKLFSGPSSAAGSPERPAGDAGGGRSVGAKPASAAPGVKAQAAAGPPLRRAAEEPLRPQAPVFTPLVQRFRLDADDAGGGRAESSLAAAIKAQTEALAKAFASRDTRHSTIKVSPTFKWPTLGDDGPDSKEIEEFYDKYEDLCRLANDGRGMTPLEHLTTLVSCLKG